MSSQRLKLEIVKYFHIYFLISIQVDLATDSPLLFVELEIGAAWKSQKFDPTNKKQLQALISVMSHYNLEVPTDCRPVLLPKKVTNFYKTIS